MKIYIPFKNGDIGGTATFEEKFRERVSTDRHVVLDRFRREFDILFIIADCPLWIPVYAKLAGKRVIQRLDGVYHPATPAGHLYPLYNLKMWIIHRFLADIVVYQSKFSQYSCERFLGETGARHTTIIYNGVDTEKIPARSTANTGRPTRLVTFAKFRRRDQIEPLIEAVKLLDPQGYSLDIYGSYTEALKSIFSEFENATHIHFRGKLPNDELLQKISGYDIFLFSDQSACPNSVLEALAAGLPVVGFNRGSMNEIIQDRYNGLLVPVRSGSDPFISPYPFGEVEYRNLALLIEQAAHSLDAYSRNARRSAAEKFSVDRMAEEYGKILAREYEK